jgi:uroporphyrin-III C-methyltransferase/precorrin-2 dehydrogenase/sirohydrochlorin ferrochelatase
MSSSQSDWGFLPLSLNIAGRLCLVLGEGEEAGRKTALLQKAGARVSVLADADELLSLLPQAALVIVCSRDAIVGQRVSEQCRLLNTPINVFENPGLSTFIFPSIIDRYPMLIAVSSCGGAPVLTRLLRNQLESFIPYGMGRLAALAGQLRSKVKARYQHINQRRRFWENLLDGPVADLVFSGRDQEAERLLENRLSTAEELFRGGEVYLVGAGPGDPDLLSFRALRLMRQADVVLYDRLVSAPILELVRRDAERIYVGKARAEHAVPQEEINLLLVRLALQNKRVLRLKGGDPFIFGRGGEEIDQLAENGIPFQVVPGITAASGCAAYAGIPLTHRDFSQSVRFVTGHLKNNSTDLCWSDLIQKQQTLVFYMGLVGLPEITRQLQAHGMPATMPVAVISKGTLPDQKVVTGTLADIADRVVAAHLPGPTIIIVGEVVSLRDKLNWLERRCT